MRNTVGTVLMLVGGALLLVGIFLAFSTLAALYGDTLSSPLSGADDPGAQTSAGMLKGVLVGAMGIPPFLLGVVLRRGARARLRREQGHRRIM
jgi:hypothetical protein